MIELEILSSPDKDFIKKMVIHRNQLFLSSTSQTHLMIRDHQMSSLLFYLENNHLYVSPVGENHSYLYNSKRATTLRRLKESDEIKTGQTLIKIIKFSLTSSRSKVSTLNECFHELINEKGVMLDLIKYLTHEMEEIDEELLPENKYE